MAKGVVAPTVELAAGLDGAGVVVAGAEGGPVGVGADLVGDEARRTIAIAKAKLLLGILPPAIELAAGLDGAGVVVSGAEGRPVDTPPDSERDIARPAIT